MKRGPKPIEVTKRFESKVKKTGKCWMWQGTKHSNGYGLFDAKVGGEWKKFWAHRFSYELYKHPIKPGDTVDHLCFNPLCVNPAHLDSVPIGENSLRSPRTLTGKNSRKTHCPQGHSYSENGYLEQGKRKCRICVRARNRRADARRRLEKKLAVSL